MKGKDSADSIAKLQVLQQKKSDFLGVIRRGDYLFLIEFLIDDFRKKNDSFPYSFAELLDESGYLAE